MSKKIKRIDQVINYLLAKWESNSKFGEELRKKPYAALEKLFEEMCIELDQETKARIITITNKTQNTPDQQIKEFMGKRS